MVSDVLGGNMELVGRLGEVGKVEVEDSRPGGNHTTPDHHHREVGGD